MHFAYSECCDISGEEEEEEQKHLPQNRSSYKLLAVKNALQVEQGFKLESFMFSFELTILRRFEKLLELSPKIIVQGHSDQSDNFMLFSYSQINMSDPVFLIYADRNSFKTLLPKLFFMKNFVEFLHIITQRHVLFTPVVLVEVVFSFYQIRFIFTNFCKKLPRLYLSKIIGIHIYCNDKGSVALPFAQNFIFALNFEKKSTFEKNSVSFS